MSHSASAFTMEAPPGNPLTDAEKRIVVAEALKRTHLPAEKLLSLFQEAQVSPDWEHMVLPPGRTMAMCKNAYESLALERSNRPQQFQQTMYMSDQTSTKRKSGMDFVEQRPNVEPAAKRRQSATDMKVAGRELAPKPSNGSPGPMGATPNKIPKKRGRPSKADTERTKAEAIAKGLVMAPAMMSTMSSPQVTSEEHSNYVLASTPIVASTGNFYDPTKRSPPQKDSPQPIPPVGDSMAKTKRKPPPKPKNPLHPGQTSFPVVPSQSPFSPREGHPLASQPLAIPQHGPAAGLAEQVPSSMHTFPGSMEPRPTTDPRLET